MKFRIVKTSDGRFRAEALKTTFWIFQKWASVWRWGSGGPVLYQSIEEAERAIEQYKRSFTKNSTPEQIIKYLN